MRPQDQKDENNETNGTVNREQRDEDQAQDVANDRLYGVPGDDHDILESTKPHGGLGVTPDDDIVDTVDQLKQMVTSGRIDMGAYAGEPMMDDGDTVVSDEAITDGMEGRGDDDIGADDDDSGRLENIADTGDDPLGAMASDHGLEDEDSEDDADPDDIDDDEFPGGLTLGEDAVDAMKNVDDADD